MLQPSFHQGTLCQCPQLFSCILTNHAGFSLCLQNNLQERDSCPAFLSKLFGNVSISSQDDDISVMIMKGRIQMRKSGLLLHISSLPGAGGIGTLGKEAYAFADFLKKSGMKIWQVLPMGPTGYGESPYQSSSVFAGNPMLISLEMLAEEGLLTLNPGDLYVPSQEAAVEFDGVRANKEMLLHQKIRICTQF